MKALVFCGLALAVRAQTVYVHVNVFDGTRLLRNQTVVVEGGVITALSGKTAHPAGATVVDGKGKTLLPALIDSATVQSPEWVQLVYDDGFAWGRRNPPVSLEALHEEIEKVHKEGKKALVEVGSLRETNEALHADADGLLRIFAGAQSDPALAKLAAKRRVLVVPMLAELEAASMKAAKPRREGSLEALRQLHAAHVPLLAGGLDLASELELMVRDVGLTPVEALQAATSVPARVLGLVDRGGIAVGKKAALLLVNGDPTVNISVLKQAESRVP